MLVSNFQKSKLPFVTLGYEIISYDCKFDTLYNEIQYLNRNLLHLSQSFRHKQSEKIYIPILQGSDHTVVSTPTHHYAQDVETLSFFCSKYTHQRGTWSTAHYVFTFQSRRKGRKFGGLFCQKLFLSFKNSFRDLVTFSGWVRKSR